VNLLTRYRTIIAIILGIALWSAVIYLVSLEGLVLRVGVENTYLISFLLAGLAGFSSLTGGIAYAAVIEFARAGADPLYLGLAGGAGLFISDSAFYVLLMEGRQSVEKGLERVLARLQAFVTRIPDPAVYFLTYLFCALGPVPNDLIIAALVVAGYPYRRFWPVLLAGDITFMLFLSYLFH
jgi:hypothetical protein